MRATTIGSLGDEADSSEFASLTERMGYMQALRAGFALIVLASGALVPEFIGATLSDLILVTAAYLGLSATVEGLRRLGPGRGLALVAGMLLVDGVYLSWVMYTTGGTLSPLRFLVYLHLIGITLLGSYRTGLKIALWHSLLFFAMLAAQRASILPPINPEVPNGAENSLTYSQSSMFTVAAFWMVALGTAAFSAVNERDLRRRQNDLQSLADLAAELENVTEPNAIAQMLLDKVCDSFGFTRGVVLGAQSGDLRVMGYRGASEPVDLPAGGTLDSLIRRAWNKRELILVKRLDVETNARVAALLPMARKLIVVPLSAEGQPLGVLVVEDGAKNAGRIERRVVAMIGQLASHASLALRNAWLLQQVQKMAETDPLTGVANRRTFETTLDREVSRAARHGEQVTLVMLDIDNFKSLNDEWGHQAGDEVLRLVAHTLVADSRDFDTTARYGGEEFALILPACSAAESLVIAERLRKSVSQIETVKAITASAGVATFPTHGSDADSLVKAADEALYESKRTGRNRVTRSRRTRTVQAPSPSPEPTHL